MSSILPLQFDFPLRALNTFGLDATAHAYLPVRHASLLNQVRSDTKLKGLPRLILGGGSNIVLTKNFPGLVLHMATTGIEVLDQTDSVVRVRAAAGVSWHGLVQWTLDHGIEGLENLSWIPGTVGASPIQNIGAYGVEVGNLIDHVRYFDFATGETATLHQGQCEFGYRDSIFKRRLAGRAVIVDVTFRLPIDWQPNLRYAELRQELEAVAASKQRSMTSSEQPDVRRWIASTPTPQPFAVRAVDISAAVIAIRSRKLPDPALLGNAGSFFKNPLVSADTRDRLAEAWPGLVSFAQDDGRFKLAAGWLIDQAGWKGRSIGAAGVYERQALVLVNRGAATSAEVVKLAQAIQADIQSKFGVFLEPEPLFV